MHGSASGPPAWLSYAALGVSGIALLVAGISLWRSQLAPMRLIVASGPLTLRVKKFMSEERAWFVSEAVADFTFTNAGARSGIVQNLRLQIDYPELSIPDAHEYFSLTSEVDPKEYDKFAKGRRWFTTARRGPGAPFVLLGRESQAKRLVFSSTWKKPINQHVMIFRLEIYSDRSEEWREYETWKHRVTESAWEAMVNRQMGLAQHPNSWPRPDAGSSFPADLHDYTGKPGTPLKG